MKNRHILIFSLSYYPHQIGGAEVAVKEITDRISKDTMQFDMITLGDGRSPREETIGNVRVYRVFRNVGSLTKLLFPFAAALKAKKLDRAIGYDAVWAIMASYAGFAAYLFKKRRFLTPVFLTIQEGDHFKRREGFFGSWFRKIFATADHIQAISRYLADWSRHMGAKCPVTVIPNGVDFGHFSEPLSSEDRGALRRQLGFADDEVVLMTASRLVYKNAVDDIIAALQHLDKSYRLLILGVGPDEPALKALVRNLKLEERVIFGGFVPHERLPQYLQASEVFVRPSRSEGLGNSFLEAMAAGIPVVATPVGGIPDFLKDGETGLFCEVGNPQSIAQKVEKLVKDRESRDYIVRQARELVRKRYGWEQISRDMQEILEYLS